MFWSSDPITTRRTQSTDNRSFKSPSIHTENQDSNNQKDQKQKRNDDLSQKVDKFIAVNKKHQFDEVCVCEDCIYVKQLQRYQSLKMDLSKNSSYRAQYNKTNLKKNQSKAEDLTDSSFITKAQQSNISKNPYVHFGSVYRNQYTSRSVQKVEKPHPEDQLKFRGPSSGLSSYKQMYSGLNGPYQYVEPIKTQTLLPRKFKAESLYANDFKGTKIVETESGKINDQLKLGKPSLVKQSTHQSQYSNPEGYQIKNQRYDLSRQKRIQTPNFSFQYKTINQDEFEKPQSKKNCRSKRLQVLHGQLLTSQNLSTIA